MNLRKFERKWKFKTFGACYPHQLEQKYAQEKWLPDSSGEVAAPIPILFAFP